MRMPPRLTRFASLALLTVLAACAAPDPRTDELPNMGNFQLGHNIVVAGGMQQIPPSREASAEEWVAILTSEIALRFGDYDGERLYHIGVAVDGYALAPPGIPLVLNPRSILVLSVNVWDDALGVKLHDEPEQIVVMEGAAAETAVIGSGLGRTREEQMQVLARNAARQIQRWMIQNPEWFDIDPEAAPFREAPAASPEVSPEATPAADPLAPVVDVTVAAAPAETTLPSGTVLVPTERPTPRVPSVP
jgi:hypothetical protein